MSVNYHPSKILDFFGEQGVALAGSHCLVAFSGGLDSSVLVASLAMLAREKGFRVTLAHVNHGLRSQADREEAFCRQQAQNLELPIVVAPLNTPMRFHESVEAWARKERYAALEHLRERVGARWILTAHHLDDQIETVVMRLVQQAPFIALAGIRPRWGCILRPLLTFTRQQLQTWAESEGLEWVEDTSNIDTRYFRNRLRHGMVFTLLERHPEARETLGELARLVQEYESGCIVVAREALRLVTPGPLPGSVALPGEVLEGLEEDVFKFTIQGAVRQHFGEAVQLTRSHWQNLRQFVRAGRTGKIFDLSSDLRLLMDRGRLIGYRRYMEESPEPKRLSPGRLRWGYHQFMVSSRQVEKKWPDFLVRSWRPGDRVKLASRGSRKLVSDLFIDARLSRLEKSHWPLLATPQNQIVWVPGLADQGNMWQTKGWRIEWETEILRK